ncbi:cytochrome P450 [Guyanagaster necrorhizus]|uniref:Cytochrome P450 n=1 Tax=Guyanagaster necrorhizus TaxID=856835 RepID=A0A9P7VGC5_9AGAR|nr:cytochrome P450 [Guyanagaster necrorhizus MCA 3950]KAG7440063.1 cytochrome P450 [Guyanagaster necrorhizus MCA 3950]
MSLLSYLALGYALYLVIRLTYSFLKKSPFQHINGPPAVSWFMGNLSQLFNAKGLPFHQKIVDEYGGMIKVHGFFGDEQLYISDPKALQSVLIKDQDAFEETAVFIETNKVIFGPGLVATTGDQHKRQRKLVNPVFSVAQLKELMPVFYRISDRLADAMETEHGENPVLDMSEWMSRVALEMIGQTILGYSFDPLSSRVNNPYTSAIKELIPTIFSLSLIRQFAPFLSRLGSPSFRRWLVEWTPNQAVQKVKSISDVMHDTAREILMVKREELGREKAKSNRDIISVLLQANENATEDAKMSENELTGQMTVLIFGAQDTTSSALSRILHLLSVRPDIQDKIREELHTALQAKQSGGRLEYDEISELPWLDAVIKETLRLYPPVPFVRRTAIKERSLTYSPDVHDLDSSASVSVPVGTTLFVGIAGANRLESIWGPDAKSWKPERWVNEQAPGRRVLPGIYAGMLSFLGGGRSCIGYRFAQIEMKVLLATLVLRFRFSLTDDVVVWNLSQIISPSVVTKGGEGQNVERKGMPLRVEVL